MSTKKAFLQNVLTCFARPGGQRGEAATRDPRPASGYTALVALEKAFAIKASPAAIWDALTADLASGDESAYRMERAVPGQELALWVELQGGIRALLTYRLIPHDDHTEVVATMSPEGLRYTMFRILTFGRVDTNYEMLLVQGLANLKRAVEGEVDSEAPDYGAPPDDDA